MIENLILDSSLFDIKDLIAFITSLHTSPCLFIPSLDIFKRESTISSLVN